MLKKNNIGIGLIGGLILPGITWLVFGLALKNQLIINNKPLIPYLASLGINLFISKYFFKNGADQTGIGIILSSFVCMWILYMFQQYLR